MEEHNPKMQSPLKGSKSKPQYFKPLHKKKNHNINHAPYEDKQTKKKKMLQ
jgi:hypothetical protein